MLFVICIASFLLSTQCSYIQGKILSETVRAGDVDTITSLKESGVDPNIKVSIEH